METSVVSISRTLAAGAEEISRIVAKELSFRYVDDEIVLEASAQAGVSPEIVGEVEHSRPLLDRILGAMVHISADGISSFEGAPVVASESLAHYQDLIQWVIRETAAAGKVVIVAHGASIPLASMSGHLRVLVTASPTVRAERLMHMSDLKERQAKKAIQDSDRERRDFFRRFYKLRQELPTHYDLVINTDRLTKPAAASLIVGAAKR